MVLDQRVESVEKLLLCAFLACKELDVINHEEIEGVVAAFEVIVGIGAHGPNHIGNVAVSMDVLHTCLGIAFKHAVADGMHQMGLAQANPAVDEQRVVARTRVVRHLQGCCSRQVVSLASHEGFEVELGVDTAFIRCDDRFCRCFYRLPGGRRQISYRWWCKRFFIRTHPWNLLIALPQGATARNFQNDSRCNREIVDGELLDFRQKLVAYPLSHETIWSHDIHLPHRHLSHERPDPGVELLGIQSSLKVGEAMTPEFVHLVVG